MKRQRQSQYSHRGFETLSALWLSLFFSWTLGLLIFTTTQRMKALKKIQKIEGRIDELSKQDFRGKRSWWPDFHQKDKENTQIERTLKHKFSIDFGR